MLADMGICCIDEVRPAQAGKFLQDRDMITVGLHSEAPSGGTPVAIGGIVTGIAQPERSSSSRN